MRTFRDVFLILEEVQGSGLWAYRLSRILTSGGV